MQQDISTFRSKLLTRKRITSDIYYFEFKKPKNFKFLPGQYVKIILDIKNPDTRGASRYFTLFSSPTEKNIAITTRIIKSSFKIGLERLSIGDGVKIRGPWGSMIFNDSDIRQIIYIAKGIGITPARSMLTYIKAKNLPIPFILFSFFDSLEDSKVLEELADNKNKYWKIFVSIGNSELKNYEEKINDLFSRNVNSRILLSGSPIFVEQMIKKIKKIGIAESQIEYEDFSGYK